MSTAVKLLIAAPVVAAVLTAIAVDGVCRLRDRQHR